MDGIHRALPLLILSILPAFSQDTAPTTPPPSPHSKTEAPIIPTKEDKRIYGVLPNNRMTENALPFQKISARDKMDIALKDSIDVPVYPTAGLFAALHQLENQNPSFGQGMAGYGRRFATAYGDQVIGNFMTEGIFPSLFHEDPRYFRLGEGSKKHRIWYSATRVFVTKMDSGRNAFNLEEWGGNSVAVAISNAYYPDTRNVKDNVSTLAIQVATDAFSNVLKEFWPDVKRHFQKHKDHDTSH